MLPFENSCDRVKQYSRCYFCLPQAPDALCAWQMLLKRQPRTLSWQETGEIASHKRLAGFDFSAAYAARRARALMPALQHCFTIRENSETICFDFIGNIQTFSLAGLPPLSRRLVLKMLLNLHSTLVMGRLNRFQDNIMTWVRPGNNKLIDRTIRFIDYLLKNKGTTVSYRRIASVCFKILDTIPADQSLVNAVTEYLSAGQPDPETTPA
jgi:N-acetylmuramic acid 6-phosphate etherase